MKVDGFQGEGWHCTPLDVRADCSIEGWLMPGETHTDLNFRVSADAAGSGSMTLKLDSIYGEDDLANNEAVLNVRIG